jgi:hypothetical protein
MTSDRVAAMGFTKTVTGYDPTTGDVVRNASVDISGLDECSPEDSDSFVVLLNVQGFDYQE